MTKETRAAVAEQARVYAFLAFIGAIAGWVGFAQQLHTELYGEGHAEFGWPLVLWLLCGVLSSVILTAAFAVAWLHRYLEAVPAAVPETAE